MYWPHPNSGIVLIDTMWWMDRAKEIFELVEGIPESDQHIWRLMRWKYPKEIMIDSSCQVFQSMRWTEIHPCLVGVDDAVQ